MYVTASEAQKIPQQTAWIQTSQSRLPFRFAAEPTLRFRRPAESRVAKLDRSLGELRRDVGHVRSQLKRPIEREHLDPQDCESWVTGRCQNECPKRLIAILQAIQATR